MKALRIMGTSLALFFALTMELVASEDTDSVFVGREIREEAIRLSTLAPVEISHTPAPTSPIGAQPKEKSKKRRH